MCPGSLYIDIFAGQPDTEKIVAAFERRISDDSEIIHNVILPDLSGDSDGRQCDIIRIKGNLS